MKQTFGWILVLVVACAICSLVTYRIAYRSGYHSGAVGSIAIQAGATASTTLAVLHELRIGDNPGATRLLESFCFDQAEFFYHGRTDYSDSMHELLAQQMLQYRTTYRTNSADWNVSERHLDVVLAGIKRAHSAGWDVTWSGTW